MHPNQLIEARTALWTVIRNLDYTSIGEEINREVTLAAPDDVHRDWEPSLADLPMVAVVPLGAARKIETNLLERIPYRLLVRTWSKSWVPDFADRFLVDLIKNLRQPGVKNFRPTANATYVQTRLKGPSDEGPKVTRCDIVVELGVCL